MASLDIEHDSQRKRFVAVVDRRECVCEYRMAGNVMVMTHTGVPPALGGRGIAAELVAAALAFARSNGLSVRPQCSFVSVYVRRHPESWDLLEVPAA